MNNQAQVFNLLPPVSTKGPRGASPFNRLPEAVRRRIYSYVLPLGAEIFVDTGQTIELSEGPHRSPMQNVVHRRIEVGFFRVCRLFYAETAAGFYAGNNFVVQNPSRLLRLCPAAIGGIRTLKLHFADRAFSNLVPSAGRSIPRQHMLMCFPPASVQVRYLELTIRLIRHYIKPNHLKLQLTCELMNRLMMEMILHNVMLLPPLSSCSISFGPLPSMPNDFGMRWCARFDAQKAMGRNMERELKPFPYLKLPRDVRLKILSYTNLVTPLQRACWDSVNKWHLPRTTCKAQDGTLFPTCGPYEHSREGNFFSDAHGPRVPVRLPGDGFYLRGSNFTYCRSCELYGRQFHQCRIYRPAAPDNFCDHKLAAYSPEGRCWHPPTSLFLVSRAFSADAAEVFYGQNHLQAGCHMYGAGAGAGGGTPSHSVGKPAAGPDLRDGTLFLQGAVPRRFLGHIRSLRLDFESDPRTISYKRLLERLRGVQLRALDLRFNGCDDDLDRDGFRTFIEGALWPPGRENGQDGYEFKLTLNGK